MIPRSRLLFLALVLLAACACGRVSAPLVGISCSQSGTRSDALSRNYSEAILRAGGTPVIIPTLTTEAEAERVLARLDGIVFSGGEDINPGWYGEEPLNETVEVNASRDRSDSLLARAALRSGKPVLAICRGEQLMNVILGGSLWQDIPTQLPDAHVHRGVSHRIGMTGEGFLTRIYGPDSLEVNSRHHQAVKDPAPGIRVTARSDDGLVEAWETPQVWAVQFHPEAMLQDDARWLALFEAYLDRLR
ncbi:MAG: gamma-glutamyl-gamma-aminobutyrate hydrolase family protein [Bacteroidales bacterium]|nr:gamma-glutamyl-gamma-aminobutyrate hydrolase family protein [Bacteroidales bacterium]